jgi:trans-aconitate methyltransferase
LTSPPISRVTTPRDAALSRTGRRYAACGLFTRYYVPAKLRFDPVHRDILMMAPPDAGPCSFGDVIDLGCGPGQLGIALLEAGLARTVLAIDNRRSAIRDATRAGNGLTFTAEQRDLAQPFPLPRCDTVLLIDVLYQLASEHQARLLAHIENNAPRLILIRTPDPDRGARSRLTHAGEVLLRRVWPHAGATVNVPTPDALRSRLTQSGYNVTVRPCSRGTPFANLLLVARRCSISSEALAA